MVGCLCGTCREAARLWHAKAALAGCGLHWRRLEVRERACMCVCRGHYCMGPGCDTLHIHSYTQQLYIPSHLTGAPLPTVLKHHKDAVVATEWGLDGALLMTADKAGGMAFWSLAGL